jgi:hypothetical protein
LADHPIAESVNDSLLVSAHLNILSRSFDQRKASPRAMLELAPVRE